MAHCRALAAILLVAGDAHTVGGAETLDLLTCEGGAVVRRAVVREKHLILVAGIVRKLLHRFKYCSHRRTDDGRFVIHWYAK